MDPVTVIAVAFSLAMDAFSVSIAYGIYPKGDSKNTALKMAASFGAFQTLMPVLAGRLAKNFELDCWLRPLVAFGFLLLIGCKMIYEAVRH